MIEPVKSLDIEAPVSLLKMLKGGLLGIIDRQTNISFADLKSYKIVRSYSIGIDQEKCVGNHVDLDRTGFMCALADTKQKKVLLFNVKKRRMLNAFDRHQGRAESVAIDPGTTYLASGGEDGKILVRNIKTGKLAISMPSHNDSVSALVFSDDSRLIASGSFDRSVHLFFIGTHKPVLKLHAHSSSVSNLLFIGRLRLLSAGRNGELIIWDIHKAAVLERLEKINDDITALCTTTDQRVLFVGSKLGYIALYDLQTFELITRSYCKTGSAVCAIACDEKSDILAVGTEEGHIILYTLFGDQEELGNYLEEGDYRRFYKAIENNPMLRYSDMFARAEDAWKSALQTARLFLQEGKTARANSVLKAFDGVQDKRSHIQTLFNDQEAHAIFRTYIDEQRYSLAYAMLTQYPEFRMSKAYEKAEQKWKRLFKKARYLLENRKGEDEAHAILAPFRGISEKTVLIRQLFDESRRYLFFDDLRRKREWRKLFELVKNYPFLKEYSTYGKVLDYADRLYIQAQKSYADKNIKRTRQFCEILLDFPDYKEDVKGMLDAIKG